MLNADALKKERDSMVEVAISNLKRDGELREAWLRCFSPEEVDKSKVIVIRLNKWPRLKREKRLETISHLT